MKIIGVDPGTARVGWGVIQKIKNDPKVISYGCIETNKLLSASIRLFSIFGELINVFKKYSPNELAIEELYFARNAKTLIPVAQARGIVLLAAAQEKVPVVSYTPLVVKQTITGFGNADKTQIGKMVMRLLKLKEIPKPDDTADALAIALTHAYSYKLKEKLT